MSDGTHLDLERHLVFYGAYHHNSINVAIHTICVPLLLASGFCLASNSGTLIPLPDWLTVPNLDLNLGTLAAIAWGGLYVLLEPVAGTALAVLCLASTAFTTSMLRANPAFVTQIALAVHVASWLIQFVGHGVFERRRPALFDNLFQALFLAPLFVWLELLFTLGYRAELQARVAKAVDKELDKFRAAQEAASLAQANGSSKPVKSE